MSSASIEWRKSWGEQGGTVFPNVFIEGDSQHSVDYSPKGKVSDGQCWPAVSCLVSIIEYIAYYNFEEVIVKLKFPL